MTDLNQEVIDDFSSKMRQVLAHANVGIMLSVGHRTGLIDAMVNKPPSTSHEVAEFSNLNERYVREWLNGMVTAKVVDYHPAEKTYLLPNEHAQVISSEAGLRNMAFFMQTIKPLADVETEIVDSFKNGGGVSYDHPNGRDVLKIYNEYTVKSWDASLISNTLPTFPEVMSLLERGVNVLDLGCGYGYSTNLMAKHFPKSNFTGYDISVEGIKAGQKKKSELGINNVQFAIQDVEIIDEPNNYQLIFAFDAIHDQAKPREVLKRIYESLDDNGIFLMIDIKASSNVEDNIANPLAPWLYGTSIFHCMTVSLAEGGEGLGTVWGWQKATELLKEAGFSTVEVIDVDRDSFNSYYVCKK